MDPSYSNVPLPPPFDGYHGTSLRETGNSTEPSAHYSSGHQSHPAPNLALQQLPRYGRNPPEHAAVNAMSFIPHEVFAYQHPELNMMPMPERIVQTPLPPTIPEFSYPQHVLPSQGVKTVLCLACGKGNCGLTSHKHFSKHLLQTRGNEQVYRHLKAVSEPSQSPIQATRHFNVVMDEERQRLLSLWSHEWSPINRGPERHLFPTRYVDKILPAAQNHGPLLQAFLALGATLWALANGASDDVAPKNLTFAVQMLSQSCPTEQLASTDEAILAAIMILIIYMALGNAVEVGKHISGLVHLVKLRGGPHYLGLSGLVAELLIYTDHMQAIYFDREPVWQLPLPPLDMGLPRRQGQGFQVALSNHNIDSTLAMAASSVCRVADIFDVHTQRQVLPSEARNAFGYLSTISEYQLATCNTAYHATSTRDECICLALILFNNVVLRNDGAVTPPIRKVEYRFWTAVGSAEARGQLVDMMPSLYLWMLITGLTVSIRAECPWRQSAVDRLARVVRAAGITTWEHFITNVLNEFVWLAAAQESTFRQIWLEINPFRTSDTGIS